MKLPKFLILISLLTITLSCGDKIEEKSTLFAIEIENSKRTYTPNDLLSVRIKREENIPVDSVVYYLNGNHVTMVDDKISLKDEKLGNKELTAKIYTAKKTHEATVSILILSDVRPVLYTYEILETYPHDSNAYTQGLEFHGDTLYESTGQYGMSSLRKTNYKTGEVLKKVELEDHFFGEGITILNNKIYQLTWMSKTGLIYNLQTLEQTGTFLYNESKEGWGLCNDGKNIYKSDGTEKIWTLNPNTLAEKEFIEIYTNTSKIRSVNELEWVDGKIFANIYQQESVAIINPENGAVEGVIDFTTLRNQVTQHPSLDVLNGIAYKGEKDILYITGKNWDKLFKVRILKK
ncbi:MAG: glutaminyl-peptide cyclotransferase [Bacteroidetes bacterium]|jgi:glutamine cyclotransferase|nr:glutaminyl-peptide cyclotransferase [Bacteroidota bacterium]